jgi:hypothetical protein
MLTENVTITNDDENGVFNCPICYKTYTRKTALKYHIPECNKKTHPSECHICHRILKHRSGLSRHLKQCKLNVVEQMPVPEEPPPIQLNSFGNETTTHIAREDILRCMRQLSGEGIPELVKKIYFDKRVPENNNVQVQSRKKHTVRVFKDGEWNIEDTHYVIGRMMDKGFQMMYGLYTEPKSQIKYDDQYTNECYMLKNLMEIATKTPKKYKQMARRIYIHILNRGIKNDV